MGDMTVSYTSVATGSPSAVFVGDSSFLLRCVEIALQAEWLIEAVVTDDPDAARWSTERGLRVVEKASALRWWGDLSADYLFSAGNLSMLPAEALASARRFAFNFHDGPLPRYAGLNATCWALLAGETAHGVCWHEMTASADAGRLAETESIGIAPDETALSLNAKCYEAGAQSFSRLILRLSAGMLDLSPQQGARTYFGRRKRPPSAGTLDFAAPAERVVATVRALDVGPYPNPLGLARLVCNGRLVLVRGAELAGGALGQPGEILAVEPDGLVVGAGTHAVRLSGLIDARGANVDPKLLAGVGDRIASPSAELSAHLDTLTARAAVDEAEWANRLRHVQAAPAPLPHAQSPGVEERDVPAPSAAAVLAGLAIWTSWVAGQRAAFIAVGDQAHDDLLGDAAPWFQRWRPVEIACAVENEVAAVETAAAQALGDLGTLGPLPRDLHLRFGRAPLANPESLPAAFYVGSQVVDPPADADFLVQFDPSAGRAFIRSSAFDSSVMDALAAQLGAAIRAVAEGGSLRLKDVDLTGASGGAALDRTCVGPAFDIPPTTIPELVAQQATRTPERKALQTRWQELTYAELLEQVDTAAARLNALGAGPGDIVGVRLARSCDLVVALLATMRTGAAYLPLDPKFPAARLELMLEDSGAKLLISEGHAPGPAQVVRFADLLTPVAGTAWTPPALEPQSPAYMIYTSGSTGRPKGVVIPHRAVVNFFAGMDARIPHDSSGVWLSVTSPSFDISVLEMFWTLARGFTVALHADGPPPRLQSEAPAFSLFYFAAAAPDHAEPYRLLFEGAKFADANGFEAIWTPERHFHAFGAPYPNPAVTAAALAAQTRRLQIRAGSCVLPLHHPIRVAEDWAVVDVMSNGRIGLAMASGWQPRDFVLRPDDFADRKAIMFDRIDQVKRLWRGEAVTFPGQDGQPQDVRTLPRPVQTELPLWLTAARSPETFEAAGRLGCKVLTHLLGMSLAELAENIRIYRAAWRAHGHPGEGRVTLMLHTFVGQSDDAVRDVVREPMKRYLANALDLVKSAAYSFPTFIQRGAQTGKSAAEVFESEPISAEERDALLEHAFDRYFHSSGLFGSPETCRARVEEVVGIGVNEIACLIDFGVATDDVLAQLPAIAALKDAAAGLTAAERFSVAEDIVHFRATHFQCTPSMAAMLTADRDGREALSRLQTMLVGGEALPLALARELRRSLGAGKLLNMYGPTETTIWSTVCDLSSIGSFIPLGEAIANTQLSIVSPDGRPQPPLAAGELWIGGDGLAIEYWRRPELTQERFIRTASGARMYRTNDLVRLHPSGEIEFLGRLDHQVKIRGHRIELGEIEAALEESDDVGRAVAVARSFGEGDQRIVAYVTPVPGRAIDTALLPALLAQRLPEIMVPSYFMVLPALPMTPNGKVDRNALPPPAAKQELPGPEASQTADPSVEDAISTIWRDLLGLETVSATTNFFDLGGHSLLAVRMQRRLQDELKCDIALTDVFRYPTIRALAEKVQGLGEATGARARGRASQRLDARRRARSVSEATHG
jgi:natural product biosynthesis luciferase-like monooxygenase protein